MRPRSKDTWEGSEELQGHKLMWVPTWTTWHDLFTLEQWEHQTGKGSLPDLSDKLTGDIHERLRVLWGFPLLCCMWLYMMWVGGTKDSPPIPAACSVCLHSGDLCTVNRAHRYIRDDVICLNNTAVSFYPQGLACRSTQQVMDDLSVNGWKIGRMRNRVTEKENQVQEMSVIHVIRGHLC